MQTLNITLSDEARKALIALAWEYLTKGGALEGVSDESIEEALAALQSVQANLQLKA